jgi:hypothetical protein
MKTLIFFIVVSQVLLSNICYSALNKERIDDSPKYYLGFELSDGYQSIKDILIDVYKYEIKERIRVDGSEEMDSVIVFKNIELKRPVIYGKAPDIIKLYKKGNNVPRLTLLFNKIGGEDAKSYLSKYIDCSDNQKMSLDEDTKSLNIYLNIPTNKNQNDQVLIVVEVETGKTEVILYK